MLVTDREQKLRFEIGNFFREYFLNSSDDPDYSSYSYLPQEEVDEFLNRVFEFVSLKVDDRIRQTAARFL